MKQTSFLILIDTTQSAIFTTADEELTSRFCVQSDCSNTSIPKRVFMGNLEKQKPNRILAKVIKHANHLETTPWSEIGDSSKTEQVQTRKTGTRKTQHSTHTQSFLFLPLAGSCWHHCSQFFNGLLLCTIDLRWCISRAQTTLPFLHCHCVACHRPVLQHTEENNRSLPERPLCVKTLQLVKAA